MIETYSNEKLLKLPKDLQNIFPDCCLFPKAFYVKI